MMIESIMSLLTPFAIQLTHWRNFIVNVGSLCGCIVWILISWFQQKLMIWIHNFLKRWYMYKVYTLECSGSVVACLTQD